MFTKHTFHSTVNPLDAKQTHRAAPPLGHHGTEGWPWGQHHPASLMDVFNISVVLYTQPCHVRLLYSTCS